MKIKVFTSESCQPCKMLKSQLNMLEELKLFNKEDNLEIEYCSIDTDEGVFYAQSYGVLATPTILFSHQHSPMTSIVGFRPVKEIVNEINRHLTKT